MDRQSVTLLELLRYADRSYTLKEAAEELISFGTPKAQATQQILEARSAGRVLKLQGEQLALSERERSGW